jgi:hypothetical protein
MYRRQGTPRGSGADRTRMQGRTVKGYYLDRGVNTRVRQLSHPMTEALIREAGLWGAETRARVVTCGFPSSTRLVCTR